MIDINPNDKFNHLNNAYKEIAEEFGIEIAKRFYESFKGLQITYPVRFLKKEYVIKKLKLEYDGSNLKELVLRYGYSERWIRKMISISLDHEIKRKED